MDTEAITVLNKVGSFPSHPCFYTLSTDYISKHLCKAIDEVQFVPTLQRCVNLMYSAYTNHYPIPMATAETESHTFLPSDSMIYVFGLHIPPPTLHNSYSLFRSQLKCSLQETLLICPLP